jgi:hypothetical protein
MSKPAFDRARKTSENPKPAAFCATDIIRNVLLDVQVRGRLTNCHDAEEVSPVGHFLLVGLREVYSDDSTCRR